MPMFTVDGISSSGIWEIFKDPHNKRERGVVDYSPLEGCPTTRRAFAAEAGCLPPSTQPWHLLVPDPDLRFFRKRYAYTSCIQPLPLSSFIYVRENVCMTVPELNFVQQARNLSLPALIAYGCELCGTYTRACTPNGLHIKRREPLCTLDSLGKYIDSVPYIFGAQKAKAALAHIVEGAASPRETMLTLALCLPAKLGGYGLPMPTVNKRVDFDQRAQLLAGHSYAMCDLGWEHVAVEYNGAEWHAGYEGAGRDRARANALRHMGVQTITVTKEMFDDEACLAAVASDVAGALGVRMRTRVPDAEARRHKLHTELLGLWKLPVFQTLAITDDMRDFWS